MSKIGKINISIPEKVKVALAGNIINIEGPLGKKSINVDLDILNLNLSFEATFLTLLLTLNLFLILVFNFIIFSYPLF